MSCIPLVAQLAVAQLGPPILTIGAVDDTLQALSNVVRLAEDASGRLYVVQLRTPSIVVFDSRGRRVATLGRAGGGPGEFATPTSVGYTEDGTIWVADAGLSKFTTYTAELEHSGDIVLPAELGGLWLSQPRITPVAYGPSILVGVTDSTRRYTVASLVEDRRPAPLVAIEAARSTASVSPACGTPTVRPFGLVNDRPSPAQRSGT